MSTIARTCGRENRLTLRAATRSRSPGGFPFRVQRFAFSARHFAFGQTPAFSNHVPNRRRLALELRVPFTTILKILLGVVFALIVVELWLPFLLFIVAVLLAVLLDPFVVFLERHRVRRGLGVLVLTFAVFSLLTFFILWITPRMGRQITQLWDDLPATLAKVEASAPGKSPLAKRALTALYDASGGTLRPTAPPSTETSPIAAKAAPQTPSGGTKPSASHAKAWSFGLQVVQGITGFFFVIVVMLYLVLEGRELYAWLVSYVPRRQRERLLVTCGEARRVVFAYMRGQLITCLACGIWVYTMLALLKVPAPLPLAAIAFIADLVPIVGTVVMTAPGVLLALTLSPMKGGIAFVGYIVYHLLESYVIIPIVYGKEMRLSTLTVILAISIGGTLQGVLGAVLSLPLAAIYPIVERHWFRRVLGETVEDHIAVQQSDDPQVVSDVMHGRGES